MQDFETEKIPLCVKTVGNSSCESELSLTN